MDGWMVIRNLSGPSWGRTSDQPGRVNSQRITSRLFSTTSPRTVHAPFNAHGSPVTTFARESFRTSSSDFVTCAPSPCIGYYSDRLSTMGTPSPCVNGRLGDPQVPLKLWSECRFLVRRFTRSWRVSTGEALNGPHNHGH